MHTYTYISLDAYKGECHEAVGVIAYVNQLKN